MPSSIPDLQTPDAVLRLMRSRGGESYFGEPVTVLEHSLQAAHFARQANSSCELIAAALLHDVGHLLHIGEENVADRGIDTRHEELADALLSQHLPLAVTTPIRLHVAAKRYLCHADAAYLDALSPSSALSLELQGGPMSEQEAAAFLEGAYAREAIALRKWDDEAKIAGLAVPSIETYHELIHQLWLPAQ